MVNTRWFKYDRDDLCVNKSQFVPVIFEPPCILVGARGIATCEIGSRKISIKRNVSVKSGLRVLLYMMTIDLQNWLKRLRKLIET
jgi:hypothetical protein